jgi:hypothetical protein
MTEKEANKKRKKPTGSPVTEKKLEELQQEAKSLCTSPQAWHKIAQFNQKKLQEWVDIYKFEKQQCMVNSLCPPIINMIASFIEKLSRTEGEVYEEIASDEHLKEAIIEELRQFIYLFNNKIKIAALLANDVYKGRTEYTKKQKSKPTVKVDIISEENNKEKSSIPEQPSFQQEAQSKEDMGFPSM